MNADHKQPLHHKAGRNTVYDLTEQPDYTFQVITDKGTFYIGADKKKQVYTVMENEDCEIKRLIRMSVNYYEESQ